MRGTKHKTQMKVEAWSSLVFHCHRSSSYPPKAPPWDSRPVSGAGVTHDHLLHRPRSVLTTLGPAPIVTVTFKIYCTNTFNNILQYYSIFSLINAALVRIRDFFQKHETNLMEFKCWWNHLHLNGIHYWEMKGQSSSCTHPCVLLNHTIF